jgi:hypothetical protein
MHRRATKILTGGLLAVVILGGGAVPAGAAVASDAAPTSVSAAGVDNTLAQVESAAHKLRDVIATLRSTNKTAEQKRTSARGAVSTLNSIAQTLGGSAATALKRDAGSVSAAASRSQFTTAASTLVSSVQRLDKIADAIRDLDGGLGG